MASIQRKTTVSKRTEIKVIVHLTDIVAMLSGHGFPVDSKAEVQINLEGSTFDVYQHNPLVFSWVEEEITEEPNDA
jgi:hypothetical protein